MKNKCDFFAQLAVLSKVARGFAGLSAECLLLILCPVWKGKKDSKGYLLSVSCLPSPRDLSAAACSIPARVWFGQPHNNLHAQADQYVSTEEFCVFRLYWIHSARRFGSMVFFVAILH